MLHLSVVSAMRPVFKQLSTKYILKYLLPLTFALSNLPSPLHAAKACLSGTAVGLPSGQTLRVRSGPTTHDSVIGSLSIGTRVKVVGFELNGSPINPDPEDTVDRSKPLDNWLNIKYVAKDGGVKEGWVNYLYISCSAEKYELPVVNPDGGDITPIVEPGTDPLDEPINFDNIATQWRLPGPGRTAGTVTLGFGLSNGAENGHLAIDLRFAASTAVPSIANGEIVRVVYNAGNYGDIVVVRHTLPEGRSVSGSRYVYSAYCHGKVPNGISEGKKVSLGDTVTMTASAASFRAWGYGQHLHFVMYDQTFFNRGLQSTKCNGTVANGCPPKGYSGTNFSSSLSSISYGGGIIINPASFSRNGGKL